MMLRAAQVVYWPGFSQDIEKTRALCRPCDRAAPSQPKLPPVTSEDAIEYPFQHVVMDHCKLNNQTYGVFCDRYTGWPGVYTGDAGEDVCEQLRRLCEDYGVPETLTTDGGSCYTSEKVKKLLKDYGIRHRISSVANPHANSRAEIAVKTVKRMMKENVSLTGKLETTKMSRALLQYRNTVDRDTGFSPAVALLGRELRDFLPRSKEALMGDMWQRVLVHREQALATREARDRTKWTEHSKPQKHLHIGEHVNVQNQTGNTPKRWDKRGVVVASNGHDQYEVRLDGSRRVTKRNRKFLRPFHPAIPVGQVKVPVIQQNTHTRKPATQPKERSRSCDQELVREKASPGHEENQEHQQQLTQEREDCIEDLPLTGQEKLPITETSTKLHEVLNRSLREQETELMQEDREGAPPCMDITNPQGRRDTLEEGSPGLRRSTRERRPPTWQRTGEYDMTTKESE